jgi:hypothetical protein
MSPIQEEIVISRKFYETLLSHGITEDEIAYFAREIVSFITPNTPEEDAIVVREYIQMERAFRKFYGKNDPPIQ